MKIAHQATKTQSCFSLFFVPSWLGVRLFSEQALGKSISKRRAQTAITQFRLDFTSKFVVLSVSRALIEYAMQLAELHALRAYDAVQLATGLTLAKYVTSLTVTFVCADEPLNKVAHSEGLAVENPNHHS